MVLEHPVQLFAFMVYVVLLTVLFRQPAVTFLGSVFVLFLFTNLKKEYLIGTGVFTYAIAIFLHAFGLDLREQLFWFSVCLFIMPAILTIVHVLSGVEHHTDLQKSSSPFLSIDFWGSDAALQVFSLAVALQEAAPESEEIALPAQQTAPVVPTMEAPKGLTMAEASATSSAIPLFFPANQQQPAPLALPITPPQNLPKQPTTLDLTTQQNTTKPRFYEPKPRPPLSRRFVMTSMVIFLGANLLIFLSREAIVSFATSLFTGKPSSSAAMPSPESSPNPSLPSLSKDNLLSLQKDFENISFRPEDITPIFVVADTPQLQVSRTPQPDATSVGQLILPTSTPANVIPTTSAPALPVDQGKKLNVALENGSGISGEATKLESRMEANNFYVVSIDDGKSTVSTIVYYKSGQKAYADRAVRALESSYTVTTQETLPNSYFADLRILVGKPK